MNIAAPHLPTRAPLTTRRRPQRRARQHSSRRITMSRTRLVANIRRSDGHPGFERHASASDLALRPITGVHSLHR